MLRSKRAIMHANSARLALPLGFNLPSAVPLTMPFSFAQIIAVKANALTEPASLKLPAKSLPAEILPSYTKTSAYLYRNAASCSRVTFTSVPKLPSAKPLTTLLL